MKCLVGGDKVKLGSAMESESGDARHKPLVNSGREVSGIT